MKVINYLLITLITFSFIQAMEQITPVYVKEGLLEDIVELSNISQLNNPEFVAGLRQANATELQAYFSKFIRTLRHDTRRIVDDIIALNEKIRKEMPKNITVDNQIEFKKTAMKNDPNAKRIATRVNQLNSYMDTLARILKYIDDNRSLEINRAITSRFMKELKYLFSLLEGQSHLILAATAGQ